MYVKFSVYKFLLYSLCMRSFQLRCPPPCLPRALPPRSRLSPSTPDLSPHVSLQEQPPPPREPPALAPLSETDEEGSFPSYEGLTFQTHCCWCCCVTILTIFYFSLILLFNKKEKYDIYYLIFLEQYRKLSVILC